MIKLSGFADEVSVDFRGQLEFLKSQGIKYIELRFVDGVNTVNLDAEALRRTRDMLEEYEIGVSAIASPIGKIALDEPYAPHFEKFRHAVGLAGFFGTKLIRMFSFYPPKDENIDDCRAEVMLRLNEMAHVAEKSGVILVHENESHIYGHNAENCVDIAETIGLSSLRLAYDPANFVWGEGITDNIERCFPQMEPYVSHIHIKDWKLGSKEIGSLPGDGDGQIDALIARLADTGYSGFVTLEPHMSSGGQFGGETSAEQFSAAIERVKTMCAQYNLKYE